MNKEPEEKISPKIWVEDSGDEADDEIDYDFDELVDIRFRLGIRG
jgi:hypothetical protein